MLGLLRLMTNFALVRLGHQLDGRLRTTILNLLPTLRDDIFQHIPIGDLAERTSSLRAVRHLPYYFGESVQLLTQIVLTGNRPPYSNSCSSRCIEGSSSWSVTTT